MVDSESTPDSSDPPPEMGGDLVPANSDPPSSPAEVSRGRSPAGLGPVVKTTPADLLRRFYRSKKETTVAAYRRDLQCLASFVGLETTDELASYLRELHPAELNCLIEDFLAAGAARKLSTATIARQLAAVRSLLRAMRLYWGISITVEVHGPTVEGVRQIRHLSVKQVRKLFEVAQQCNDPKKQTLADRDYVILRLLFDLALRRAEVVSLDVEHVDLIEGCLWVLGKGKRERIRRTLPEPTQNALAIWLTRRGLTPGPLFMPLDRAGLGSGRLTTKSVARVVKRLARRAGLGQVLPHDLRRSAITRALDATNGNVREVREFSRHVEVKTVLRYDKSRRDMAGDVAKKVADSAPGDRHTADQDDQDDRPPAPK